MSDFITTTEAAQIIGVKESRVRQLLRAEELDGERFGRDWLIRRRDAMKFKRTPPGPIPGKVAKSA